MSVVTRQRKIKVLNDSYTLDIPESIKVGEVLNEKLLNHILKYYPLIAERVIIQGDRLGIYSIFFEKALGKNVTLLEPNRLALEIVEKNLLLNKCNNVVKESKVLNSKLEKFSIYIKPESVFDYILVKSTCGEVESFSVGSMEDNLGCILINSNYLNNVEDFLSEIESNPNNEKCLIVIKKNCYPKGLKFKTLKIIDEQAGYYFVSKSEKSIYVNFPIQNNNEINDIKKILQNIEKLTVEVNAIKAESSVSLNFFNVINTLRPTLEHDNLLKLEQGVGNIINIYEKEIYNLNKTIEKRNNKIKALLNSNTWKYTQFARNKLGFNAITYSEYLEKNKHVPSFDQKNINKIRSEIYDITNNQNKINTTLIDVIQTSPIKNIEKDSGEQSPAVNVTKVALNSNIIKSGPSSNFIDPVISNRYNYPKKSTLSSRKFAGLAALPSRESALKRVVSSLITQVDQVGVYLNGWDRVPDFLDHPKVVIARSQDHGDLGDAGKFFWIDGFDGYYFSCDDDLVYPVTYTQRIINKIKDYNYQAVVGWHGSAVSDSFKDYYDAKDRRVFSYSAGRPFDLDVHILGTGVLGFHTSTINVKLADFEKPNMADIFFARLGQLQKVRFIVMEHMPKEIETIEEFQQDSINKHGQQQVQSIKNVRHYKNAIATSLNWHLNNSQPLNILLVGRFENFKKGGIHKSNLLIEKYLKELGHKVHTIDSQSTTLELLEDNIDVAMIYPGDPRRPDYPEAIQKMEILRSLGVPILLNMSYNSNPKRSEFISQAIQVYNQQPGKSKVCLMAFSESVKFDNYLKPIMKYIVSFPKTIDVHNDELVLPSFKEREGIFFGDATKLNNSEITNGKVINWISEARKRMPKTNFYVIKHYSGKFEIPNFEFAPYMDSKELMRWIANKRLSICLNQFTTYEMVPVESQLVGTPVIYRSMPQSLNEAIGLTGIPVTEPSIFGEMCQWLYNDEVAWREYSRLSLLNFKKNHISTCRIGLETALRKVIAINGAE